MARRWGGALVFGLLLGLAVLGPGLAHAAATAPPGNPQGWSPVDGVYPPHALVPDACGTGANYRFYQSQDLAIHWDEQRAGGPWTYGGTLGGKTFHYREAVSATCLDGALYAFATNHSTGYRYYKSARLTTSPLDFPPYWEPWGLFR